MGNIRVVREGNLRESDLVIRQRFSWDNTEMCEMEESKGNPNSKGLSRKHIWKVREIHEKIEFGVRRSDFLSQREIPHRSRRPYVL